MAADHLGCWIRKQVHWSPKNRRDRICGNPTNQNRIKFSASSDGDPKREPADRITKQCESIAHQTDHANGIVEIMSTQKPSIYIVIGYTNLRMGIGRTGRSNCKHIPSESAEEKLYVALPYRKGSKTTADFIWLSGNARSKTSKSFSQWI